MKASRLFKINALCSATVFALILASTGSAFANASATTLGHRYSRRGQKLVSFEKMTHELKKHVGNFSKRTKGMWRGAKQGYLNHENSGKLFERLKSAFSGAKRGLLHHETYRETASGRAREGDQHGTSSRQETAPRHETVVEPNSASAEHHNTMRSEARNVRHEGNTLHEGPADGPPMEGGYGNEPHAATQGVAHESQRTHDPYARAVPHDVRAQEQAAQAAAHSAQLTELLSRQAEMLHDTLRNTHATLERTTAELEIARSEGGQTRAELAALKSQLEGAQREVEAAHKQVEATQAAANEQVETARKEVEAAHEKVEEARAEAEVKAQEASKQEALEKETHRRSMAFKKLVESGALAVDGVQYTPDKGTWKNLFPELSQERDWLKWFRRKEASGAVLTQESEGQLKAELNRVKAKTILGGGLLSYVALNLVGSVLGVGLVAGPFGVAALAVVGGITHYAQQRVKKGYVVTEKAGTAAKAKFDEALKKHFSERDGLISSTHGHTPPQESTTSTGGDKAKIEALEQQTAVLEKNLNDVIGYINNSIAHAQGGEGAHDHDRGGDTHHDETMTESAGADSASPEKL